MSTLTYDCQDIEDEPEIRNPMTKQIKHEVKRHQSDTTL